MLAIVLVGGFGTRLQPLTNHVPKQMLPICGLPMIEWVALQLAKHGVSEMGLALGYRPDAFLNAYPGGTIAGLPYRVAVEPEVLGTAGAIRFALEELDVDETVVALNGDVLTDLDITALVTFHQRQKAEGTIALQSVNDPSRFGVVTTDKNGRVAEFVEKPPKGTEPSNLINAGTYVLEPEIINRIPAGQQVSVEREIFPHMAREGSLYAVDSSTYWLDTGTPEQFIEANLDVMRGLRDFVPELPTNIVDPSAQIEESFLGEGTEVGANARIKGSVLLSGCKISNNAKIRNSVLAEEVQIGDSAEIDGCVIGRGEVIEPGSEFARIKRPN